MARPNHAHRPIHRLVVVALATIVLALPATASAKHFSAWDTAQPEAAINTETLPEGCPIESPNGLELYIARGFSSDNVGGTSDPNDVWRATRSSVDSAWSAPSNLGSGVNSTFADFCPTPLNGNFLLFVSARSGAAACGTAPAGDIYLTRNNPAKGWETPRHLGCDPSGPNTPGPEFSPSLVETDAGTFLFYSRLGANNLQDIYVSQMRADGTFTAGSPVEGDGINLPGSHDQMPNVSRDGLEMVFASNRSGGHGAFDVYVTTRESTADEWSAPQNLGPAVNTNGSETRPSLSGDRERLHFGRAPLLTGGGFGPSDVYVSVRTKVTGSD